MFDMTICSKQSQQNTRNLRKKRKSLIVQCQKKKNIEDIKVPFVDVSFVLDINNNDSFEQFKRLIQKLSSIQCSIQIFDKVVYQVINTMNLSIQSLRRGHDVISCIFPILNEQQRETLYEVINETQLQQWIRLSYNQAFNFLVYACQGYLKEKIKVSSDVFLNLVHACIKVDRSQCISFLLIFFQQITSSYDLSQSLLQFICNHMEYWISKQPLNSIQLITKIIDLGFSDVLTKLQSMHQISIFLFKNVYANNPSLLIRYISLLKIQGFNLFGQKTFSILSLSQIMNKLLFQKIISQLCISERINFYRFVDSFSKILSQLEFINKQINFIKKIKNIAIQYQQENGSDQSRSYAEGIKQVEQNI